MDFQEVLDRRFSCRQYADKPVERAKLITCLEAGRLSPSGCNSQRWAFIAVDDSNLRKQLAETLRDSEIGLNHFAEQIPAFIVVVKHPPRRLNAKQEQILAAAHLCNLNDLDIGIASQQICLAATNQGLGSIMLGWFDPQRVREILDIPEDMGVPLMIGIGYPSNPDKQRRTPRYPAAEIIRWNGFQKCE